MHRFQAWMRAKRESISGLLMTEIPGTPEKLNCLIQVENKEYFMVIFMRHVLLKIIVKSNQIKFLFTLGLCFEV